MRLSVSQIQSQNAQKLHFSSNISCWGHWLLHRKRKKKKIQKEIPNVLSNSKVVSLPRSVQINVSAILTSRRCFTLPCVGTATI